METRLRDMWRIPALFLSFLFGPFLVVWCLAAKSNVTLFFRSIPPHSLVFVHSDEFVEIFFLSFFRPYITSLRFHMQVSLGFFFGCSCVHFSSLKDAMPMAGVHFMFCPDPTRNTVHPYSFCFSGASFDVVDPVFFLTFTLAFIVFCVVFK